MNSHIENFLRVIEQKLPKEELLSSNSLINAGIVKSKTTLSRWRNRGNGPAFIRLSKGQIRYIRSAVLDWLQQSFPPAFITSYSDLEESEPILDITQQHNVCPHSLNNGYENMRMITEDCHKENAPDDCRYCGNPINFEKGDN